jgi:hypothetical protein
MTSTKVINDNGEILGGGYKGMALPGRYPKQEVIEAFSRAIGQMPPVIAGQSLIFESGDFQFIVTSQRSSELARLQYLESPFDAGDSRGLPIRSTPPPPTSSTFDLILKLARRRHDRPDLNPTTYYSMNEDTSLFGVKIGLQREAQTGILAEFGVGQTGRAEFRNCPEGSYKFVTIVPEGLETEKA